MKKGKNDYYSVEAGGKVHTVVPFAPPKFAIDDPKAYQYLNENGYAVIANVATNEELEQGKQLYWKYMNEGFPNVKKDDINTWGNDNWPKWGATGIIQADGAGQSEFQWYVRGLPNIKRIFSNVWDGEDDLLVSFDSLGMARPPEYNPDWATRGGWFHFDQNGYSKPGRHCVQGLLNFLPSGPKDGGFVVVPRTHFVFDHIFATRKGLTSDDDNDFVRITKKGMVPEIWSDPQYYPIKLCIDPGDFVLWDSRTAHCNHPVAPRDWAHSTPELRRLVSYVCMTPLRLANNRKQLLENRLYGFKNGLTTSHWPQQYQPRGEENRKHPEFFLDDHQKSLLLGKDKARSLGDQPLSSK